ncbi:rhodanese-like domain-containing protein [Sulfitobacter sp. LCG007]
MTHRPADPDLRTGRGVNRRLALLAGAGALGAAGLGAANWFNILARTGAGELSAEDAHAAAARGELLLIDIRRPEEWRATGIGAGAIGLDMRRDDFVASLDRLAGGDRSRRIALICARGVRSRRTVARLRDAGFTEVLDVPEGMLGSGAGAGWLQRELPLQEED